MRAIWAVLAGLLGGIIGYIITAIIGFVFFDASSPGDSGGTAMGILFGLAPLGAGVGAILGLFISLRRGGKIASDPASAANAMASDVAPERTSSSAPKPGRDYQALIAVGVILAIIAGLYFWLFYQPTPSNYFDANKPKPLLMFEVSVPTAAVDEDNTFKVRTELRSWQHVFSPRHKIKKRTEGAIVIYSGIIPMHNKVDDRKFWLYPSRKIFVEFKLDIPAEPKVESVYGKWRPSDNVEIYPGGDSTYPLKHAQARLRTRVVLE